MFNPAQEMSSIAFDKILGGALTAVVEAQNNSSLTTVNFIKNVGFENDQNGNTIKPVYVDFKYPKEVSPYIPARPKVIILLLKTAAKVMTRTNSTPAHTLSTVKTKSSSSLSSTRRAL